jgi:hypothetical protein
VKPWIVKLSLQLLAESDPANGVVAVIVNLAADAHPHPGASYLHGVGLTFVVHDGEELLVFFWLIPSKVKMWLEVLVRFPSPTALVDEPVAEKNTVTFALARAAFTADHAPLSLSDCQGADALPLRLPPVKLGSM